MPLRPLNPPNKITALLTSLLHPTVRPLRPRQRPTNRLPRIQSRPQSPRLRPPQTRPPLLPNAARHPPSPLTIRRPTTSALPSPGASPTTVRRPAATGRNRPAVAAPLDITSLPNDSQRTNCRARPSGGDPAGLCALRYGREGHDHPRRFAPGGERAE